jgi:PAS domain-containing protein
MQQKSLVLILARGLADELASAVFLVDQEGTLVYYNDSAAQILGKSFGEAGEMRMEEWAKAWAPVDTDGQPLEPDELPLVAAVKAQRINHRALRIQAADGEVRDIAVTALPLFARREEFVGAVAVFWEHDLASPSVTSPAAGER